MTEIKGLYDEKKNIVKAETETYIVQKPVPNTTVSICFQFQFLYIFRF